MVNDFKPQREDLFNPTSSSSLDALWRIFTEMLKQDDGFGQAPPTVHCIIDGLDELHEGNLLTPFIRKVARFFEDERRTLEDFQQGRIHPNAVRSLRFASLRMILLSREAPPCLRCRLLLGRRWSDFVSDAMLNWTSRAYPNAAAETACCAM